MRSQLVITTDRLISPILLAVRKKRGGHHTRLHLDGGDSVSTRRPIPIQILINGERWIEDPSHGFKREDGFGGFNSILVIGG